jgi:hypothetical protein
MGYAVTLTNPIDIDWSKESSWIVGYVIEEDGTHHVLMGDISGLYWINDYSGWRFNCDHVCIPAELSPLKNYKGHPKDSLHRRPSNER